MIDNIKKFLYEFVTAVQTSKLYSPEHPQAIEAGTQAFTLLIQFLETRDEITIKIVNGVLAWKEENFPGLTNTIKPLVRYLQDRSIKYLVFRRGIKKSEFTHFITLLIEMFKDESYNISNILEEEHIQHISAEKFLDDIEAAPVVKTPDYFMKGTGNPLEVVARLTETVLQEEALNKDELRGSVKSIMNSFSGTRHEFLDLTSMKDRDIISFLHLLNVSILSMSFSSKLGYSIEDVIDIGISALFHDIGKLYISKKIQTKELQEEEEELYKIQHHTIYGANILLKYSDSIGIMPFVVAYEHHIRHDLQGYPRLSFPIKPHTTSAIVTICDVYDSLAQRRSYKKDFSPLDIYNTMIIEREIHFDPLLLDRYFQVMGVWPKGTLVTLSDGSIAVVREPNEKNIFAPKVEVVSSTGQSGLLDLSDKALDMKVEFSLNPFAEGKKYLSFI
ncbi:HD-GYP domain-containing protein [Acidobacteriota bacterium]